MPKQIKPFPRAAVPLFIFFVLIAISLLITGVILFYLSSLFIPGIVMIGLGITFLAGLIAHESYYEPRWKMTGIIHQASELEDVPIDKTSVILGQSSSVVAEIKVVADNLL